MTGSKQTGIWPGGMAGRLGKQDRRNGKQAGKIGRTGRRECKISKIGERPDRQGGPQAGKVEGQSGRTGTASG